MLSDSNVEVLALMGPTASGKTALAMALHDKYPVDIISVDSALIYRGMDIGTAKPSRIELDSYPHQLIDIVDPADHYSVAQFRRDALTIIENCLSKGRKPLLVGGTMLYFKALIDGLSPLPSADPLIRKKIAEEASKIGWQALHTRVEKIDPCAAKRIHPNDRQRLSRLLEVYLISGQSLTELTQVTTTKLPYRIKQFALIPERRDDFSNKLVKRFHTMLEQGFENEVAGLMSRGDLSVDLPAMRCVGYRQMWDYLAGNSCYDDMVLRTITATRQLAKRQMTWLRSWPKVTWLNGDSISAALTTISAQLEQ